jgi:hypothetical protein
MPHVFRLLALSCLAAGLAPGLIHASAGPVCDEDCRPVVHKLSNDCYLITATMDGGPGAHSIDRSRQALKETIDDFRRGQPQAAGWARRLRVTAMKPAPNPYMRSVVTRDLMLGEARSAEAHTVCWRGVVAPAVCTSGARVCK